MRTQILKLLTIIVVSGMASPLFSQINRAEVKAAMIRTADWQLAHPNENQRRQVGIRQWHMAPLYNGLLRLSFLTGEARYLSEIVRLGELANWSPGDRIYHADDYAVGQAWLDVYSLDTNHPERVKLWRERYDHILENPPTVELTHLASKQTGGRMEKFHDRWSWADALFMAPPTLARLYEARGDVKYLDFIESEWRLTHRVLYDPESHLYYRDTRFVDQRLENGKKILWARGNGWVYGGLALTLEKLPKNHALRPFLENIFREMSASLKQRQQADGLWYPNLDDAEHIPVKESSGTGLMVYGMAWGINQGLLSREEYWPHIEKGWAGLLSCVQATGMLGYVQPVGASPVNNIKPELTHVYGTGAFLLAGSEIMKALGAEEITTKSELLDRAEAMAFDEGAVEAIAIYQPYRKDDIAWENDKMAFRTYGPALRDTVEDSGVDCWMKSVPTPVLQKWYADDLAGKQSYHQDHGEGYDGYKVGAARGCGGTALWTDEKLETSNVWRIGHIIWSPRDEARVNLAYYYRGEEIHESKLISLKLGDDFCEVTSRFTLGRWGPGMPGIEIAVGLTAQEDSAQFHMNEHQGWMAIWDQFPNGDEIGTGIRFEPSALQHIKHLGEGKGSELAAILKTDHRGRIHYRMGFTWNRSTLPSKREDWLELLSGN